MFNSILVTGGAGFIGSNYIKYLIGNTNYRVINLDSLTYAGNLANLSEISGSGKYFFVHGQIQDYELVKGICQQYHIDCIVNFAAETHVDRSIQSASPFIQTNIVGTQNLLEVARELRINKFIQVSTDEVYGSLPETGKFTENTPLAPNSPYSASKASADLLVRSYYQTFGINTVITRCSNNYGPYQFPEKLIPLMILNAMENKPLPVYGDGLNVRDWIYVQDHCRAVYLAMESGKPGEVYNIGGSCEMTNIEIVETILKLLGKPKDLIKFVKDRPGHDRRYAIDASKITGELGWLPETDFDSGIQMTVEWYLNNPQWTQNIRSGAYMEYYKQQYGNI